jgi:hypothetical protein
MYKDCKRLKEKKDASEHIDFPIKPIISKSLWDKIQEKTAFNKSKGKRVTISNSHWLRDMLYCAECGGRIKARYGSKRKDGSMPAYYCCFWSQTSSKDLIEHDRKKCSLPHIQSDILEERIWTQIGFHLTVRRDKYLDSYYDPKKYDSLIKNKEKHLEKITNEIAKRNRSKEKLYSLLEEETSYDKKEFLSRLHSINEEINIFQSSYKDQKDEMQEMTEGKKQVELIMKIKENKSMFRSAISRDLRKMSINDKKRLAEDMFGKIFIGKDSTDPKGFKVSYYRYGPVNVIEQFVKEGKLHSFNLNGSYNFARSFL